MVPCSVKDGQPDEGYPIRKIVGSLRPVAEFEVIEIVDDNNPYLALLGIEWALNNNAIINLKKRQMSFNDGKKRITTPIDPEEGHRYVEPVKDERELYNIYNITSKEAGYVDLDADGKLSWKSTSSWDGDSD